MSEATGEDGQRDFPPQHPGESDAQFVRRTLLIHRNTHQAWIDYLLEAKEKPDYGVGSISYQRDAVQRYTNVIEAFDRILATLPTPRDPSTMNER